MIISSVNTDYSQWIHSDVGSSLHIPNADVLFGKKKEEKKRKEMVEDEKEDENRNEVVSPSIYNR